MAPKFRGDSEDWFDQQGEDSGRRSGRRESKARPIPRENTNATVAEVFPNQARVRLDEGAEMVCNYRRSAVIGAAASGEWRERSPVAVGDRVSVERVGGQDGVISGVASRETQFLRPAPGREEVVHVIAANVELLCIVGSAGHPPFSAGLVDRFLIASEVGGLRPVLIVNKIDLFAGGDRPWELYRGLGVEVLEVSAKSKTGIDDLKALLLSRKVVFCGQSGVGKTSLLSTLMDREVGRVGELSEATGKGRHTTTGALLLDADQGSQWVDTPGVREFGLIGVEPDRLREYFPEFGSLACQKDGCLHDQDTEDDVACEANSLARYPSYRRILESLRSGER